MQRPVKLVIYAGIVLVLLYFVKETFLSEENYTKPLLKEREDKDLSFRSRTNSPFTEEGRQSFKNLVYYEPNVKYKVSAKVGKMVELFSGYWNGIAMKIQQLL